MRKCPDENAKTFHKIQLWRWKNRKTLTKQFIRCKLHINASHKIPANGIFSQNICGNKQKIIKQQQTAGKWENMKECKTIILYLNENIVRKHVKPNS